MGKSSDLAFRISVSEPYFYPNYFVVTLHDSKISFVLCHPSAYNYDCQVKRFYESFQKTGESLWKTVFIHESQYALHNAVQLQWMLDRVGVGVDEHIGSFQYAMGIILKSINQ